MKLSATFLRTDLTDVTRQYFDAAGALIGSPSDVGVVQAEGFFFVAEDPPELAFGIEWHSAIAGVTLRELLPDPIYPELLKVPRVGFDTRWTNLGTAADRDDIRITEAP